MSPDSAWEGRTRSVPEPSYSFQYNLYMASTIQNNKRIAQNTILLYIRMFLMMAVSLYTSRVILSVLGVEDYGIYNVVGGVISMLSFINGSMASSTQRFLTIEIGKKDFIKLKEVFSTAVTIHFFIAIFIVILSETIGLWFLNNKLNIPANRLYAANWVFQFSILTCCINVIQVPYNAIIIAHEKMSIYAYISIVEAFLKLITVYLIAHINFDKLIIYAIILFIIQLTIRVFYQIYCKNKYTECKNTVSTISKDLNLYKTMASFASWNLLGSIAWILRDQGVNILLNLFYGPIINASKGIASQVSGAIMGFITNFQVALNPPITKYYATGDIFEMEKLVYRGIKFSFCILFIIAFPIILNINFILEIWLKEVPSLANIFITLILIDSLIGILFGNPLTVALSATGIIKKYQTIVSLTICSIIPISYILLKLEFNITSVFYAMIILSFITGCVRFYFCKKQIGFSIKRMFRSTLFPIIKMIIISIPIPLITCHYWTGANNILKFTTLCSISIICIGLTIWFIVLSKNERVSLFLLIKNKVTNK